MDTLFRLVSLQSADQSFNTNNNNNNNNNNNTTSRTSSSSRSSKHTSNTTNNNYHHYHQEEECSNFFMDEDDFSSSSSKQFYPYHHHLTPPSTTTTTTTTTTATGGAATPTHTNTSITSSSTHHHGAFDQQQQQHDHHQFSSSSFSPAPAPDLNLDFTSGKWASDLLLETGRAIADKNSSRVQQLMWMLNELSSPYGDTDQKLTAYFLQALFSRMTDSGQRCYQTLTSASEKNCSFESTRKMVLKFQEVSPWTTFGHAASNGAILEAFEGESKLHIVDFSNTYCTQWPTLLEALATRTDETPHLRLSTVVTATRGSMATMQKVMKEISNRMEKFARLMGVPFKFNIVHHTGDLSNLNFSELDLQDDEALAINCVGTLHSVPPVANRRDVVLSMFRQLQPKIVAVVEEEADFDVGVDGFEFVKGFQECLRWYRVYFESLDETFPKTSNERLMLERAAGRSLVDLLACPAAESVERREVADRWSYRLRSTGFNPVGYSDDVSDDVRALLRRYKEGWSMTQSSDVPGIFLTWKDQPLVWASAWKP